MKCEVRYMIGNSGRCVRVTLRTTQLIRTAYAATTTPPFHFVDPLLLFLCAAVCCRMAVVSGVDAFHHPTVVDTKAAPKRRRFLHSSSATASSTLSRLNDSENQRSFSVHKSTTSVMVMSTKGSKPAPGAAVAAEGDNTNDPAEAFSFCHSDIARILKGPILEEQKIHFVDRSSAMDVLLLHQALNVFDDGEGGDAATVEDLIDLAATCDEVLFSNDGDDGNSTFLSACWRNNESSSSSSSSSQQQLQHQFLLSLVEEVRVSEAEVQEGRSKPQRAGNSYVTVATLLALNVLETTIKQLTISLPSKVRKKNRSSGGSSGAPLLRNMLRELEQVETVPLYLANICSLLLLPNDNGLNFRNLIWHGFVAAIPRPWFSLVVILIYELQQVMVLPSNRKDQDGIEQSTNEQFCSSNSVMDLRAYPELEQILTDSGSTVDDAAFDRIVSWVEHTTGSPEHTALCRLGLKWMCPLNDAATETRGRPATICAVLSVVLEHCLRLEWCRANDRPEDVIACPGAFYVTLDGHGQRHVHDLILHPYLLNATEEHGEEVSGLPRQPNKLLWGDHQDLNVSGRPHKLDASTATLLTDLFCSPFGPNIRAAAAHGQWNVHLTEEWVHTTDGRSNDTCQQRLWDMTHMLCYVMDRLSSQTMDDVQSTSPLQRNPYHPVFTYAQIIRRSMARARQTLSKLKAIDARYPPQSAVSPTYLSIQSRFSSFDPFHVEDLLLSKTLREFSVVSLEKEYELNCQLAVHGRTRNLLEEVANALEVYAGRLFAANTFLGSEETQYNTSWKRKQKTATRLVAANESILSFYKFSYWVALSALQSSIGDTFDTRSVGLLASPELVRRTSMTLSTIDTFVDTNLDRAIQAISEYSSSRALKELLRSRKDFEAK